MLVYLIATALLVLTLLSAIFYAYRRLYAHKLFIRLGIPGPKPNWVFGNILAFTDDSKRHLIHAGWTQQFGKVYGYYEGPLPTLVTSDVDILEQVFIKQFHCFHARKEIPLSPDPDNSSEAVHMFTAHGDRWKRLRTIVNPTFSVAKLRALEPLMLKCQADFMQLIDKRANENKEFDIFKCFQLLTLDTISEAAFGMEVNSMKTEGANNPLLEAVKAMFDDVLEIPLIMKIAMILPEATPLLRVYEAFRAKFLASGMMKPRIEIMDMMAAVIKSRQQLQQFRQMPNPPSLDQVSSHQQKEQRFKQDLLQIMLDLEDASASTREALMGHRRLTPAEITAQAMLFMIAGYETSSTALAFISYLLASNPQVQDKVLAEIDATVPDISQSTNYDTVDKLEYLECVIKEALRLYPVALLVINRTAMETTVVSGIPIPQGLPVQADVWSVHHDPEQWGPVDVNVFHPERFQADYPTATTRSEAAYLPFGLGPRLCIANLLMKYRLQKSSSQLSDNLKLRVGFTISPKDGVWVRLTPRCAEAGAEKTPQKLN